MSHSFSKQLQQELPHLWRFAWRLSGSKEQSEELVQWTMLKALEKRHQFQANSKMRQWTFKILHNLWKNDLRANSIRQEVSFAHLSVERLTTKDASQPQQQLLLEVMEQVNQLPEAQRMVMILVCVEGHSYQEVAEIMDIPKGTVMSRLARARITIGEYFLGDQQDTGVFMSEVLSSRHSAGDNHEH